ncbi:MAG: hypothetical protein R3E48_07485 [Burkholderiaceae bacterium]
MSSTRTSAKLVGVGLILLLLVGLVELLSYAGIAFPQGRNGTFVYDPSLITKTEVRTRPTFDPRLGWLPRNTDSLGARIDRSGQTDVCVEVYGDSFTWSDEVDDEHAWPNRLSSLLRCRVANFGVGGYGSDQAVMRYEANRKAAKLVILGHMAENILRNVNQFRNLVYPGNELVLKPRYVLSASGELGYVGIPELHGLGAEQVKAGLAHDYFVPDGPSGLVSGVSFPYTLAALRLASEHYQVQARFRGEPTHAAFYRPGHPSNGLATTTAIVQRFVDIARSNGQRALVTLIPTCRDLEYMATGHDAPYQPLIEALRERRIETFDFSRAFLETDFVRLFHDCVAHPNEKGYAFMADVLHKHLREVGAF